MLFKKYNSHLFWTLKYLWLLFPLHRALTYGCGCCCCWVTKSFSTLCNPQDYSMPASLSPTMFQSLLKLMFIESVMPFTQIILCCPLFLLPSIFPSIRWPKYWSFVLHISPSNESSGLISFRIGRVSVSHSVVSNSVTPWTVGHRLLCPWDFPGKNTGVGCHSLLQGIFLTQGLNPGQILYIWAARGAQDWLW